MGGLHASISQDKAATIAEDTRLPMDSTISISSGYCSQLARPSPLLFVPNLEMKARLRLPSLARRDSYLVGAPWGSNHNPYTPVYICKTGFLLFVLIGLESGTTFILPREADVLPIKPQSRTRASRMTTCSVAMLPLIKQPSR
jgi:hypothetical protein